MEKCNLLAQRNGNRNDIGIYMCGWRNKCRHGIHVDINVYSNLVVAEFSEGKGEVQGGVLHHMQKRRPPLE